MTKRSCAAQNSKVKRHISYFGAVKRGRGPTETKVNIQECGLELVHQTLSVNCASTTFEVCERLVCCARPLLTVPGSATISCPA